MPPSGTQLGLGLGLSTSTTPSNKLLDQFGDAAAAYSLQDLSRVGGTNVVRARRSTDDAEQDFTAGGVSGTVLRNFALNNDADLIRFANQSAATDKRMYFDGVDDEVTGVSIPFNVGDTLKFSLTLTSTLKYVVSGPPSFHRIMMSTAGFQITVNGVTSSLGISVSEGQPHDVELVRTSGNVDVYIDGNLEGSVSPADTAVTYTSIGGKSGQASGTGLYRGVIYDVESLTGGVSNALYNGYGNTNADWEDQVGSNDGTVLGSPALFSGQGFDAFVTTWYDQSGNGRNATQATAASQPQIVADGVVVTDANGNASMDFDGTSHEMTATKIDMSGGEYTATVVVESDALAGDKIIFRNGNGSNNGVVLQTGFTGAIREVVYQGVATLGDGTMSTGTTEMWSVINDGATTSMWVDGTSEALSNDTSTMVTPTGSLFIGSNSGSLYWNGHIAEIIVYESDKSSDRAAIESNIANRYGITI